ncbi:deoxyribose operon repressor [Salmonella enterica subsp. arizonae]|nr:deoxyribose operon repressor [Salmonella enterica subsp. arizonae]SUG48562.1 deoxyribose operon repressor [Salmonella enterica subsp. arizonae]
MTMAQCHVLVVDHSKFGKVRPARMGELSRFDTIISDRRPDDAFVAYAKAQHINLMF